MKFPHKLAARSFRRLSQCVLAPLALLLSTAALPSLAIAADLTVFAAVSTTGAMTDIGVLYEKKTNKKVQFSFGATSTLARQIERGAPVDIFLSADQVWMDYLLERKLIDTSTRKDILANTLALIVPAASNLTIKIEPGFKLAELLKGKRLAVGDPDHTAVGIYARESLQNLGIWSQLEPVLARADSVRASLAMVERGEVGAGILFGTEAAVSKKVRLVDTFPASSHKPINYPVAVLAKAKSAEAKRFIEFLSSPEAARIFQAYGFVSLK